MRKSRTLRQLTGPILPELSTTKAMSAGPGMRQPETGFGGEGFSLMQYNR